MSTDFFHAKRPWSKYKDSILRYYLSPYIAKVAKLRKPILIVDCFAGCGQFADGEPGSPLIIAEAIQHWQSKGVAVAGEFIEADTNNYSQLESALKPHSAYAKARLGRFENVVTQLASRAQSETLFLYIDPYTVKGLVFSQLKAIYDQIRNSQSSVEVLMNFNVATFMRWALAALQRTDELPPDATNQESDYQSDDPNESVELSTLNAIAGGEYWQAIASTPEMRFTQKLDAFTNSYVSLMLQSFTHVCKYPVKSKYSHQTPKYMLIYATRHSDGLELMNDAMCEARDQFLGSQFQHGLLFDMTPPEEDYVPAELKKALLRIVQTRGPMTRKELRVQAFGQFFCRVSKKTMNEVIGTLLKARQLFSATGKARINDSVRVSTQPFTGGTSL